ncbi:MAG: hypothetical protein JNL58_07595 [Planctomyces sp.]|nr:hypothetical protein [Planctomyces sp.]
MKLEHLPLWKRIAVGYATVAALVVVCGFAGVAGICVLDHSLAQVTGPAWQTANGIMDGSIEIQSQMIAAENILDGIEVSKNEGQLSESRKNAEDAFKRVKAAGIVPDEGLNELNRLLADYEHSLDESILRQQQFVEAGAEFKSKAEEFIVIGEYLETIGDSQVEELENNPDLSTSWSQGLSTKWAAADGGMESSIGFLTQLYFLERLIAGADFQECSKELTDAQAFQQEALEEMIATGVFDVAMPEELLNGKYAGQKASEVFTTKLATVRQLMSRYIDAYQKVHAARDRYIGVSGDFLKLLEQLEAEGDTQVDSLVESIQLREIIAYLAIGIPVLASLVVAWWAGRRCTRSVTEPIDHAMGLLKETTGTAAAAVSEMSATISTIAQNTERAAGASRGAAEVADRGRASVAGLGQAAEQINGVVKLIESVAAKTNLLALNATIEAARAGDTGKGFAVVANEVKALARQTADATAEIRLRLAEMQSATECTVGEISQIFDVIRQVDDINQDIARALEEQNTTTAEISRCVRSSTDAADHVSAVIAGTAASLS